MAEPHIVILGGGPAGVGGAYQLARTKKAKVTLLEANPRVGGNAGSFFAADQWLDFGSHRLHHACDPEILGDIRRLLKGDLSDRPRNGRIRLRGKWVKFPLQAKDLMLRLDKGFALGATRDMIRKQLPGGPPEGDTFASVLEKNLGPTICEHFYFPYARKIWGRDPVELSGIQAHRRVSSGTFSKLIKKVIKPPGSGHFYYPREGFGQISRAYADAAVEEGADLRLGTRVEHLEGPKADGTWTVVVRRGAEVERLEADHVWSTLPVTLAARMMNPSPPEAVLEAASRIDYRAMVLVYVQLEQTQFRETDAHYFPEEDVSMTRLSEPKNYYGKREPTGRTVLCAEVPCEVGDHLWEASDEELGRRVVEDMKRADLPVHRDPVQVFTRRLPQAYPIYLNGYEAPLEALDHHVSQLQGFLTYGRQGLFAHDNTHHALAMAYAAVDCLRGRDFDRAKWAGYRQEFAQHVVED